MNKKIKFKRRLLPDLVFPQVIQKIKESGDSRFLLATGLYPPQLKCFDLEMLTLKFKRHLDSEVIDFQILTSNWEKLVFLKQDRSLEFHSKAGCHYQLKLNSKGTDLVFDSQTSVLYIPSNSNEIFRLDLSEGKFLQSIRSSPDISFSCSGISPVTNLIGAGTSNGWTQFWDPRSLKKPIGTIRNTKITKKNTNSTTAIRFNEKISHFCYAGQKQGQTMILDLRSFGPILVKKNQKNSVVKSIRTNFKENTILTSGENVIKLWNEKNGKTWKTFETQNKINHVCKIKNSGFFFIATEAIFPETKFFDNLGKAPVWIQEPILESKSEIEPFKKAKTKFLFN